MKKILQRMLSFGKSSETGEKKTKPVALLIGIAAAVVFLVAGVILLLKKIRKRRMEKEAAEAEAEHCSTDPDADEYADEDTEA